MLLQSWSWPSLFLSLKTLFFNFIFIFRCFWSTDCTQSKTEPLCFGKPENEDTQSSRLLLPSFVHCFMFLCISLIYFLLVYLSLPSSFRFILYRRTMNWLLQKGVNFFIQPFSCESRTRKFRKLIQIVKDHASVASFRRFLYFVLFCFSRVHSLLNATTRYINRWNSFSAWSCFRIVIHFPWGLVDLVSPWMQIWVEFMDPYWWIRGRLSVDQIANWFWLWL